MFEIIALLCVLTAIGLLVALSIIDLKHWILPDELNLAFAVTGFAFHMLTAYRFVDLQSMALGALAGGGMLYVIRYFSNRHYQRDTLGLGDVKLMAAAGIWLGLDGVLQAITVGAFAGLLHGFGYAAYLTLKTKAKFSVAQLSIPAGPGFAVGIVVMGYLLFGKFVGQTLHDIFA